MNGWMGGRWRNEGKSRCKTVSEITRLREGCGCGVGRGHRRQLGRNSEEREAAHRPVTQSPGAETSAPNGAGENGNFPRESVAG